MNVEPNIVLLQDKLSLKKESCQKMGQVSFSSAWDELLVPVA